MDIDNRKAGAAVLAVLVLLSIGLVFSGNPSGKNCESVYDRALEGEISSDSIPEKCRPLPEEVEDELLRNALTGNS